MFDKGNTPAGNLMNTFLFVSEVEGDDLNNDPSVFIAPGQRPNPNVTEPLKSNLPLDNIVQPPLEPLLHQVEPEQDRNAPAKKGWSGSGPNGQMLIPEGFILPRLSTLPLIDRKPRKPDQLIQEPQNVPTNVWLQKGVENHILIPEGLKPSSLTPIERMNQSTNGTGKLNEASGNNLK